MNKLYTIAKNTFIETLRQPIYAVINRYCIVFIISKPVADHVHHVATTTKLLREIGLSTLFVTSLFIAIFSASGAVAEEMRNKTVTTVLSKPVERPIFILAKFFGVAAAVVLGPLHLQYPSLLMSIRHGVLETASDTHDWTVRGHGRGRGGDDSGHKHVFQLRLRLEIFLHFHCTDGHIRDIRHSVSGVHRQGMEVPIRPTTASTRRMFTARFCCFWE